MSRYTALYDTASCTPPPSEPQGEAAAALLGACSPPTRWPAHSSSNPNTKTPTLALALALALALTLTLALALALALRVNHSLSLT